MESNVALLDGHFVGLECPSCQYEIDVQLLSVRLEETVFCPCCKRTIQLVDAHASAHRAQKDIGEALNELERQVQGINRVLTIRI